MSAQTRILRPQRRLRARWREPGATGARARAQITRTTEMRHISIYFANVRRLGPSLSRRAADRTASEV